MYKETELYKHAKNELDMLVELEREDNLNTPIGILDAQWEERGGLTPQELINSIILDIISSIDSTKLDRVSLNYIADVLNRLLNFQNLSPLSLIPAEFEEVATTMDGEKIYQNRRNLDVFKTESKGVYHLDGPAELDAALGEVFNID